MKHKHHTFTILMADDDVEDCMLAADALRESQLKNPIKFVHDGEELLAYLRQEGEYAEAELPGLILLDLNMPRKDGREALQEIRSDPKLRRIPVVILTTSKNEADIYLSYDIGANSYITKPVSFQDLVNIMRVVGRYWFETVEIADVDNEY